MERSTGAPATVGRDAAQRQLARALRGACGAPCAAELSALLAPATEALAAARERDDRAASGLAQAQIATALGVAGDSAGAVRARASAASLLARAGGAPPQRRRALLLWLTVVDWGVLGDVRAARDRLARAAVLANAETSAELTAAVLAVRVLGSAFAGDLLGAASTAREAVAFARERADPALLLLALAAQTRQLTVHGELRPALAAGEELLALRDRVADTGEFDAIAAWAVAPALLEAGATERCAALLLPAAEPATLALLLPQAQVGILETCARLALAREQLDEARKRLAELETLPFASTPLGSALNGCIAALVELAEDRPLIAEVRATAAAEAARRAPSRLLELHAIRLAGEAQAALGAPEVAIERFAEAEAIARAIGAHPRAELAARRRRSVGGVVGTTPSAAHYGLTPRQLEIAELVADGRTNREVAKALGISEHTVNTHLRVAFARLGVSRRTALATALSQRAAG